jgi:hypothetical protein
VRFFGTEFEKRLRTLHRAELEKSPELRREFKRRRKTESSVRAKRGRNLFALVLFTFLFFLMVQGKSDLSWALAIVALWATGTAFKWGHQWFQQFYASEDLVVLNFLPLNDRQIFQFQLRQYLRGAGWIFWELLLAYLVLTLLSAEKRPPAFALAMAGVGQAILVLALALHAASYLHILPLGTLAGLFRMTAIVLVVMGVQEVPFTNAFVRATEWFLPTGWINYMLLNTNKDSAVLALCIPICAIIYLAKFAFDRLRAFYSLEGFEIIPGPTHIRAEEEDELSVAQFNQRAGPTEIEDRIAARHFLEGVNWNLRGALEKLVARFLSPRERVVTEFLVAQDPGWTRSLKWSFWVWLVVTLVVLSFGNTGMIVFFGAYLLGMATLPPLFGGEWRGMRQSSTGGIFIPGYSLYPITFNEIARILFKVNVVRILAATPFIVIFGAIAALKLGHSSLDGAIVGSKLIGTLLCLQPFLLLLPISGTTNDFSRMGAMWTIAFVLVLLTIIVAALGIFLSDTFLGVAVSFVIVLLLSILLFAMYRKAYRSGGFDLLNARARADIA